MIRLIKIWKLKRRLRASQRWRAHIDEQLDERQMSIEERQILTNQWEEAEAEIQSLEAALRKMQT
jgi:hypothetical protein